MNNLLLIRFSLTIGRSVLINISEVSAIEDRGEEVGRWITMKNGTRFEVSETLKRILTTLEELVNEP